MMTVTLTPFAANVVQALLHAGVLESNASLGKAVSFLKEWSPPAAFRPEFSGMAAFDAVERFHRSLGGSNAEVPQPVEDAFQFFNAIRSHRLHELVVGKVFQRRLGNYYEAVADAMLEGVALAIAPAVGEEKRPSGESPLSHCVEAIVLMYEVGIAPEPLLDKLLQTIAAHFLESLQGRERGEAVRNLSLELLYQATTLTEERDQVFRDVLKARAGELLAACKIGENMPFI